MPDDAIERARECLRRFMRADEFMTDDTMDRIVLPALLAFASQQAPGDRTWTPHFDYAGEPMREGHFRDPPEGWVLVPREPTEAMLDAGVCAGVRACPKPWCPAAWSAMLDAAPSVTLGEVG
jgi:hypothetical protein